MGPAVGLENGILEVLDAQRKPRHAELAERLHLRFRERPWLALERHLLGIIPAEAPMKTGDEPFELLHRQKRRRAAAEVDIAELAAGDGGLGSDELCLPREPLRVAFHVAG